MSERLAWSVEVVRDGGRDVGNVQFADQVWMACAMSNPPQF